MDKRVLLLPLVVASSCHLAHSAESKTPNVLIFLVDDMGWSDLGCYGSDLYITPNVDKFASKGVSFTNAYSACTVSSPTRASLITGKYPARLHLTDWITGHDFAFEKKSVPQWRQHVPLSEHTIAEELKKYGYHTWQIGKWHLTEDPKESAVNQGFDKEIGINLGFNRVKGEKYGHYFGPFALKNLDGATSEDYLTDRLTDEAVNLIEGHKGSTSPFFMYFAHYAVHTKLEAKQSMIEKYRALVNSNNPQHNPTYAAMVESVDESFGRVVSALEQSGELENTLIVFTSDNGSLVNISPSLDLRAGKGSEYEGGVRVPLIMYWNGEIYGGREIHTPAITMDITSTILDIVKSPMLSKVDGVSLLPAINGVKADDRALFWHYPHYHYGGAKGYSAVRYGNWRLIEQLEDGRLELYNLAKDSKERRNLATKDVKKCDELYNLLVDWRREVDAQMMSDNPEYNPKLTGLTRKAYEKKLKDANKKYSH